MAYAQCKRCGCVFYWYAGLCRSLSDLTCPKCGSRELRGRVTRKEAYRAWREGRYVVSPDEREYWEGCLTVSLEARKTGVPEDILVEQRIKEVEAGLRMPWFLRSDYSWLRDLYGEER